MTTDIDSVILTDIFDNRLILNNVCYVSDSEDRIISMMKFRREYKIEFQFTGPETFIMIIIKDFNLTDHSVNDILYTTIPQTQANIANIVVIRDTVKCQINEVSSDTDSALVISEVSEVSEASEISELIQPFRKRLRISSSSLLSSSSLIYSSADL